MSRSFTRADDLTDASFRGLTLHGARFVECDLSGVVMRGVDLQAADLDAPWLTTPQGSMLVNGVDVAPFVESELNRRLPGRALRRAADVDGLRAAWSALEGAWGEAMERAESLPDGAVDARVAGEWSFAETLRHLVLATDAWIGRSVLGLAQPFHPLGLMFDDGSESGDDAGDPAGDADDDAVVDRSVFTTTTPTWAEVLDARASRTSLVRDLIAGATDETLDATHPSPWRPSEQETTRSCLHVVLEEEWEHLRFALRDLDTIAPATPATD